VGITIILDNVGDPFVEDLRILTDEAQPVIEQLQMVEPTG
jgi:hypothetical protein